jgi:Heparinase II/III-like protein/Heparinase II/III N-terminus
MKLLSLSADRRRHGNMAQAKKYRARRPYRGPGRRTNGLLAAFAILAFMVPALSEALAAALDLTAYNIREKPEAGPVETFQPVGALPPVPFRLPFDWSADPYDDQNWRFNLHTLRIVDPALAAGDFDYAREVVLDWQRWHENCWIAGVLCFERVTDQSWDDMATGIRASRLAYLLRSTGWNDESLIELAEQHAERLKEPEFIASNNHALFQLQGLAALCLDRRLRACDGADAFIESKLDEVLRDQFTESGMHRENSPGYHFFVTDTLARVAPLLEAFAPKVATIVQRAESNKKWLVHPDGTTVQLGDSSADDRHLIFPHGNPRCRAIRSYPDAPNCYLVQHFDDVGYAIVRSDWAILAQDASMLFVRGGFFERTHRDADDFSFEWFERGRRILSDSGKYGYTRDEWNEYFDSTRAHNTVEVGGENYSIRNGDTYADAVKRIERTADGVRITMEVHHVGLDTWHRREIAYSPGEQLIVGDTLRSEQKRRYVQWHHFAHAFELSGEAGHFLASDDHTVVTVEASSSCGEATTYEMIRGQIQPRIQGWASVGDRERHPRWALGVACEAETATLTTRFAIVLDERRYQQAIGGPEP